MFQKRGQLTIFMILALVILLVGILYFYTIKVTEDPSGFFTNERTPLVQFVDNCLTQVSDQGLRILGQNGGYIYFPQVIESNPRSYLQFGPLGTIKNPYWWHDGIEAIPSLTFMEEQIEQYIENEIDGCTKATR